MGEHLTCLTKIDGKEAEVEVWLESEELIIRNRARKRFPFASIDDVRASGATLHILFKGTPIQLRLTDPKTASRWFVKIRYPKPVIDKLGVKEGMRVSVIAIDDVDFLTQVRARTEDVSIDRLKKACDLIFLGVTSQKALGRVKALEGKLKQTGGLWLVWPKGSKSFGRANVMEAGRAAQLVDVKVCAFSESHSALKFVIPKERRTP